MNISNIGIIVDGPTEKDSLEKMFKKIYYNIPIIRYGPGNGVSYSEQCFAKNIAPTIVFLLCRNVYSLILIPDFEKREKKKKISLEEFAQSLKKFIVAEVLKIGQFTENYLNDVINVCPSNIMFENWIVSDVEGIKASELIKKEATQDYYDGRNGASLLDDMLIDGLSYKKTRDAQNLFKYVNPQTGINYSPSFKEVNRVFEELLNK